MSSKIRVLSEHTINQIAAGEVIENPSSVVKELVENAVDAGAKHIRIETWGGGLQKIVVSDDGCGMGADDAVLCLERHATSKIASAEDLVSVATMGFRGEALASVAAIAKVTIETSSAGALGTKVEVEAGQIKHVGPCARNQGTTIEVRQLFYNVPARRKFQKSPSLCMAEITKACIGLSLAHPTVSFECIQQEKVCFSTKAAGLSWMESMKRRIEEVLGAFFLEESFFLDAQVGAFSFRGVLGSTQNTRPNRASQYQFINTRQVFCPIISYAVKDAYSTRIGADRFPIYVLHADLPYENVDVNVHPQKKEIRLHEEKEIRQRLQEKVLEALQGCRPQWAPTVSFDVSWKPPLVREETPPLVFEKKVVEPVELPIQTPLRCMGLYAHFAWVVADLLHPFYSLLGVQNEGTFLIDLERANARLLFDALDTKRSSFEKQGLLLPLSLRCSSAEAEWILAHQEEIEKMGFSFHLSGSAAFLIDAIPSMLKEQEALDLLQGMLPSDSMESKAQTWEERRKRELAGICSRLAKSRKTQYAWVEAEAIIAQLVKSSSMGICPQGNRIVIYMGKDEIQGLFSDKRRGSC